MAPVWCTIWPTPTTRTTRTTRTKCSASQMPPPPTRRVLLHGDVPRRRRHLTIQTMPKKTRTTTRTRRRRRTTTTRTRTRTRRTTTRMRRRRRRRHALANRKARHRCGDPLRRLSRCQTPRRPRDFRSSRPHRSHRPRSSEAPVLWKSSPGALSCWCRRRRHWRWRTGLRPRGFLRRRRLLLPTWPCCAWTR